MVIYMDINDGVPENFPQYFANTAREMAEAGRRTERAIEEMGAITAAFQRDSRLARETLHEVASGLSDYNETAYQATNRATDALIQFQEESKGEMKRLAEVGNMLATFLSSPRDEGSPGDEEPTQGDEVPPEDEESE